MPEQIVARKKEEGTALWVLGGLYEIKATGAETGGAATIVEMTLPVGTGPPPHRHPGTEMVYVLEGTVDYHIDGETVEGSPGSFFSIPAGTLENFEPTTQARLLVIYSPGGIDEFFEEVGQKADSHTLPPPSDEPPDMDRIVQAAERYGMEIQAPAN